MSSLISEEQYVLNDTLAKIRSGNMNSLHAHRYHNNRNLLPDTKGVTYTIYDVAPPSSTSGRGRRRVVTGTDGSIYYTNSHYGDSGGKPFYQIK